MAKMICTTCGHVAEPKRVTKGSTAIEIFLWLCFLAPGLIYSIWRLTSKYDACPKCKSSAIVPVDSPIGKKLAGDLHPGEEFTSGAEKFGRKIGAMFAKK